MVNAIVLMTVKPDMVNEIATQLVEIPGVSEVYSVGGRFDLVAVLRVPTNEALAEIVTGRFLKIEGITDSETLIAFKAYSKHDLERMFSVGME